MKTLIVYYSRTGLTRRIAQELAVKFGADVEEISDPTNRSGVVGYLRCGREAVTKILPALNPLKFDPANYDLVIVGTPVWASTMSSPVRSYLTAKKDALKRVACFVTQGGTAANKTVEDMAALCGRTAEASMVLVSRDIVKNDYADKLETFINSLNTIN